MGKKSDSIWTAARDMELVRNWADGLTAIQIAEQMGCFAEYKDGGRSAVIGRVARMREQSLTSAERVFWTRGSGSAVIGGRKSDVVSKNALQFANAPKNGEPVVKHKPPTSDEMQARIAALAKEPPVVITPVTYEEAQAEHQKTLMEMMDRPETVFNDFGAPSKSAFHIGCREMVFNMTRCGKDVVEKTSRCAEHGGLQIAAIKHTTPNHTAIADIIPLE